LTKAALKAADPAEAMTAGTDPSWCTEARTRGSTGVPMQILLGRY
jgi:hypothetical protein